MKKLVFIFMILFAEKSFAQDIHFSQVLNNPLQINPANTGGYEGYERLVMNYRNQWSVVGAKYNTMGFSFDMPMFQGNKGDKAHMGLGLVFFSDKAGDSKMGINQGAVSLSGIVPFNKENKIAAGIQLGYGQRTASLGNLQWGNQFNGQTFDATLPSYETNTISSFGYMDMGAGLRYEYRRKDNSFQGWSISKVEIGVAMYHINQPRMQYHSGGSEQLNRKLVLQASGHFDLPVSTLSLIPFITYYGQSGISETNVGMLFRMKLSGGTKITGLIDESALYFGAQYRMKDAIIPYVGYDFKSFGVAVTYDHNISTLKTVSRGVGGFEISIKYHNIKGALFTRRSGSRIYD